MPCADENDALQAMLRSAMALHRAGMIDAAVNAYLPILQRDPACFDALHLLGVAELRRGNLELALVWLDRATAVAPSSVDAQVHRGAVTAGPWAQCRSARGVGRAIAVDPYHVGALTNRAAALLDQGQPAAALASVVQALALDPEHPPALYNHMSALRALGQTSEALVVCEKALRMLPPHADLLRHHAALLRDAGRTNEALAASDRALTLNPTDEGLLVNRAHALSELGHHDAAASIYSKAHALNGAMPYLPGWRLHAQLQVADWDGLDVLRAEIAAGIDEGRPVCEPFVSLLASLDRRRLRRCAELYARHQWGSLQPVRRTQARQSKRLRLGYFSADFHEHPTAQLCAGAIENHDRRRFEVVGLELGPPIGDSMRTRLRAGFDHFINLHDCSDSEAVEVARRLGIDIAIDLGGYTRRSRTRIFALRAAPLQVSWLGFAGTLGAPFMDYLLADGVVVPHEHGADYAEKIVRLPRSYQPNDDKRRIAERWPSRGELGLPAGAFVFCCFNSPAKITPEVFAIWMRLLRRLPSAVLWLLGHNTAAMQRLRRHAQSHGIDPGRLIFAQRLAPAEHLARHRAADLFLDTWPYNAHTTASDALWAGLPLLTVMGETFGSRVAASLLHAVGLPELVTASESEYEERAVALASDPEQLHGIRARLGERRQTHELFDTTRFTRGLMAAYEAIWQRHREGLAPAALDLTDA